MFDPDQDKEDKKKSRFSNPLSVPSVDETKKQLEALDKLPVSKTIPPFVKEFMRKLKAMPNVTLLDSTKSKPGVEDFLYEREERKAIQDE